MRENATVGILMDTNMTPPQGVFVDFFGVPACTASGLARVALHTGAAVVPAFTIWDPVLRKYRVEFDPRWNWCAPATTKPTPSPTPRSSPKSSRNTCAAILTSGFGYIDDGRRGPRGRDCCINHGGACSAENHAWREPYYFAFFAAGTGKDMPFSRTPRALSITPSS